MEAVCDEQGFVLGPRVAEFEAAMARYVGCRHAIGCASGSDALLLALMALGVKSGDEVITVPFTFFQPREPFQRLGARPVFVDIDSDSFNIDPRQIERAITPRTKAVIPCIFSDNAPIWPLSTESPSHGVFVSSKTPVRPSGRRKMAVVPACSPMWGVSASFPPRIWAASATAD